MDSMASRKEPFLVRCSTDFAFVWFSTRETLRAGAAGARAWDAAALRVHVGWRVHAMSCARAAAVARCMLEFDDQH